MDISLFEVRVAVLVRSIAQMDTWPQIRAHLNCLPHEARHAVQELEMSGSERAQLKEQYQKLVWWLKMLRALWRVRPQDWSETGLGGAVSKATASGAAAQATCLLEVVAQIIERKMHTSSQYWLDRQEVVEAAGRSAKLWLEVSLQTAEHVVTGKKQFRAMFDRDRIIQDMGQLAEDLGLPRAETEALWSRLCAREPNAAWGWLKRTVEICNATARATSAEAQLWFAYGQYKGRSLKPGSTGETAETGAGEN